MKYASLEEKQMYTESNYRELILEFEDGENIDNSGIYQESMEFIESISEEGIVYGSCISSIFKVRAIDTLKSHKGLKFKARTKTGEFERKIGKFIVDSDELTDDRMYRDIIAYDELYKAKKINVTEWYESLKFPTKLKDFRNSLFSYIGITQKEQELPNDSAIIEKTIQAEEIYFQDVIQAICEVNASFGHMNSDGLFEYIFLHDKSEALYPSESLYPSEDLYPDDYVEARLGQADYIQGTLKFKEYNVKKITQVQIRQEEDDIGAVIGEEGNLYVIQDNFLLYGKGTDELTQIANNFLEKAVFLEYYPAEVQTSAKPWMELGDNIRITTDKFVVDFPILSRTLSGIIALRDTYSATGTEYFSENDNPLERQIIQLKGKTSKLNRTLEEFELEFSDFSKEVKENYSTTTQMNSAIKQKANEITQTVSETYETQTNASATKEELQSSITQNASSIEAEVKRAIDTEVELAAAIKVNEEGIKTKVEQGDVVSEINQSADKIELKGNRIIIEADNLTLTEDGRIECTGAKIKGTFEAGDVESLIGQFFKVLEDGTSYAQAMNLYTGLTIGHDGEIGCELGIDESFFLNSVFIEGTLYTASGTVSKSDKDIKNSIEELDKEKVARFIYSLKPSKYKLNNGTSGRYHHGLIAQEVKESMGDEDWGLYVDKKPDEKGNKALRHEELIADLIATIQSQNERISALEKQMEG